MVSASLHYSRRIEDLEAELRTFIDPLTGRVPVMVTYQRRSDACRLTGRDILLIPPTVVAWTRLQLRLRAKNPEFIVTFSMVSAVEAGMQERW